MGLSLLVQRSRSFFRMREWFRSVFDHTVPPPAHDKPADLVSWKQIANHLNVSVRTAQMWEAHNGLPVSRLPGKRARVSCSVAELDHWRETAMTKHHMWQRLDSWRYYATAIAIVLLAAGAWWALRNRAHQSGPPALWHLDQGTLVVSDAYGRRLWAQGFNHPLQPSAYGPNRQDRPQVWFGDLDGDAQIETLFPDYPADQAPSGTALVCFSQKGSVKWRFTPGREVVDGGRTSSRAYRISQFAVVTGRNHVNKVVVTSQHYSQETNQAVVLSPAGTVVAEHWHDGYLPQLETSPSESGGEQILLGGADRARREAVLISLDANWLSGCAQEQSNRLLTLRDCGVRGEKSSLWFPRSRVSEHLGRTNEVASIRRIGESYRIGVREGSEPDALVEYQLNQSLQVVSVEFSPAMLRFWERLEQDDGSDHGAAASELERLRSAVEYR